MTFTSEDFMFFLFLYLMFWVSAKYLIQPLLNFIRGKPIKEDEAPDILRLIYKKRKRAARWNKRKMTRRILCEGDRELDAITFKQSGILTFTDCAEPFFKPNWLTPGQWAIVPVGLIREFTRRSMRIRCRGFAPWGENIWIPMLTIYDAKNRDYYIEQIWKHFNDVINHEGAIIQQHLRANGISTASITKEISMAKLRMKEALPRIMEEGKEGQPQ